MRGSPGRDPRRGASTPMASAPGTCEFPGRVGSVVGLGRGCRVPVCDFVLFCVDTLLCALSWKLFKDRGCCCGFLEALFGGCASGLDRVNFSRVELEEQIRRTGEAGRRGAPQAATLSVKKGALPPDGQSQPVQLWGKWYLLHFCRIFQLYGAST